MSSCVDSNRRDSRNFKQTRKIINSLIKYYLKYSKLFSVQDNSRDNFSSLKIKRSTFFTSKKN